MTRDLDPERGSALVLAMLVSVLMAFLGASMLMTANVERRAASNTGRGREALAAAEAGVERAIVDLRNAPDWSLFLNGSMVSTLSGGGPLVDLPAGGHLDLDAATRTLQQSDLAEPASAGDATRWRLMAWGPLSVLAAPGEIDSLAYLTVWIGDDPDDGDGEPLSDRNGVVILHGEARAGGGTRRAIDATVRRVDPLGVRVVTWREVR
jgi:hypothetical protein